MFCFAFYDQSSRAEPKKRAARKPYGIGLRMIAQDIIYKNVHQSVARQYASCL